MLLLEATVMLHDPRHSTPVCDNTLSHQQVSLAESTGLCQSACMTACAVMMCAEAGCVHSGGVVATKY